MSVQSSFRCEKLDGHDRTAFSCGTAPLDSYFLAQVTQDIRRGVANCYVLVEEGSGVLAGFFTLASSSVPLTELPADIRKRLPRYPSVPAALLGRMAVDARFKKRGLGAVIVAEAAARVIAAASAGMAAYALIVDAKDSSAKAFYEHLGFRCFASAPSSLFLPIDTFRSAAKSVHIADSTTTSGNDP